MSTYSSPSTKPSRLTGRKLYRAQDLVEGVGWLTILYVIFSFLVNGGVAGVKDLRG
ncbi:MAG: hypothetical protein ACKOFA_02325 [Rhodoluna sp.]